MARKMARTSPTEQKTPRYQVSESKTARATHRMNPKRWNYVPTERMLNGESYLRASKYFYVNGKRHPAERTPNGMARATQG